MKPIEEIINQQIETLKESIDLDDQIANSQSIPFKERVDNAKHRAHCEKYISELQARLQELKAE